MTRRDRLKRILDRLHFAHCDVLYQASTIKDLEDIARARLRSRALGRHNYRVMSSWAQADFQAQAQAQANRIACVQWYK